MLQLFHIHSLTSTTWFGALRPAFQRPLISVQLGKKHIVVGNKWQEVLMYYVLISQTNFDVIFQWNDLQQTNNMLLEN